MQKYIMTTLIAFTLTGCASFQVTDEDVQSINTGEKAIIVMTKSTQGVETSDQKDVSKLKAIWSGPGKPKCYPHTVWVSHLEGNMIYPLSTHSGVGRYSVPPGTYALSKGSCSGYNQTGNMPLLDMWFMPIEVNAGEIVNIGEIQMNINTQKIIPDSDLEKTFNALIMLSKSSAVQYATYEINEGDIKKVKQRIKRDYPDLKGTFVTRIPKPFFTESEFIKAIAKAYETGADGKPIEEAVGRERLNENLRVLTVQRIQDLNGED